MKPIFNVKSEKNVKEWYEREDIAQKYLKKRFQDPMGRLRHNSQVKIINLEVKKNMPKTLLDLACGPARVSADIKGEFEGIAADNSDEMLEIAKQRLQPIKWKIKKVDAFNLNFKEKFGFVTSFRFVRHFEMHERKVIYGEIRKILKPSGIFIFDVVNFKKWKSIRNLTKVLGRNKPLPVYDKFYNVKEIKKELKENGFKVVKMQPIINHFLIQYIISKILPNKLAFKIISWLDEFGGKNPWEWVVVCKKIEKR